MRVVGSKAASLCFLSWFLDQAIAIKQQRVAGGDLSYGGDETRYGEWAADVQRPAEQFRGRYQPRLAEARGLIASACVDVVPPPADSPPSAPPGGAPPPTPPDVTPPTLAIARSLGAKSLGKTLAVPVRCPAESCVVWATGSISVPTAARVFRISASRRTLASGIRASVRLSLGRKLRKAAARALGDGRKVKGSVVVHATDSSGNETAARRPFELRRP